MRRKCEILEVGRRRDGGYRFWCVAHRSDATAKYGRPAIKCLAADDPEISRREVKAIDPQRYKGGIALWGAVPAVFDTTREPMDRGIHVHARESVGGKKVLDSTFRRISVLGIADQLFARSIDVEELDAIYFMVSSVFGKSIKFVRCTYCAHPHLDKDWFSVHPHKRHLCHGCGRHFSDTEVGIGNPIAALQTALEMGKKRKLVSAPRSLSIRQADYVGGLQIWGSNPALLWTGARAEEEGIHVHAFRELGSDPDIDDTFKHVAVDGIPLEPRAVRYFMAQMAMPHIRIRVISLDCPRCQYAHFDDGDLGFTPHAIHRCNACGKEFSSPGRLKQTISNPMGSILERLAHLAPRAPQDSALDLRPETI